MAICGTRYAKPVAGACPRDNMVAKMLFQTMRSKRTVRLNRVRAPASPRDEGPESGILLTSQDVMELLRMAVGAHVCATSDAVHLIQRFVDNARWLITCGLGDALPDRAHLERSLRYDVLATSVLGAFVPMMHESARAYVESGTSMRASLRLLDGAAGLCLVDNARRQWGLADLEAARYLLAAIIMAVDEWVSIAEWRHPTRNAVLDSVRLKEAMQLDLSLRAFDTMSAWLHTGGIARFTPRGFFCLQSS